MWFFFSFKMLEFFSILQIDTQTDALNIKMKAAHSWPMKNILFSLQKRRQN